MSDQNFSVILQIDSFGLFGNKLRIISDPLCPSYNIRFQGRMRCPLVNELLLLPLQSDIFYFSFRCSLLSPLRFYSRPQNERG